MIAKYAREERLAWERNLKEKGLWTQAQERRSKRLSNKDDSELYAQLEYNFSVEPAETSAVAPPVLRFGAEGPSAMTQSMQDARLNATDLQSQDDAMHIRDTVQMMA